MFRDILSSIDNVGLLPSITFIVFFAFFLVILFLAIRMDRKQVKRLSELPLNDQKTS